MYKNIAIQETVCKEELAKVAIIQDQLGRCLKFCAQSRGGLARASEEFTGSSLGLLAKYRRRLQTVSLLRDLSVIQTLQRTEERLQSFLEKEDFFKAISLLIECQKVAVDYGRFKVIRHLSLKFADAMEMTEEHLDVALAKVCIHFNEETYSKLHTAYGLLEKTQVSMDQMHMHITSSIHNQAWNIVYGHASLINRFDPNCQVNV